MGYDLENVLMRFIVDIPEKDIDHVNWEGVNRQSIAKFIREELRACGGQFFPLDWRRSLLDRVEVKHE